MKRLTKLWRSFVGLHLIHASLFDAGPEIRDVIKVLDSDAKIGYNKSMENEEYEDDEIYDGITEEIMPFLRIYVSAGREDHDMLEIEDVVDFLTSENRSVNDTIKHLIEQGMANVYACSFNKTVKVF